MEVEFTPEQEAGWADIAATSGISAKRLVERAATRALQIDERFRAAFREGIAQADRGTS